MGEKKRFLTDKHAYTRIAASERSGESGSSDGGKEEKDESEPDDDEGDEDEMPTEDKDKDDKASKEGTEKESSAQEGEESESGSGSSDQEESEEEEGEGGEGADGEAKEGEAGAGKKKDDKKKKDGPSAKEEVKKKARDLIRNVRKCIRAVPWKEIAGGTLCVSTCGGIIYLIAVAWCVTTPWTEWTGCSPKVEGAPHCGAGANRRTRSIMSGNCHGTPLKESYPCDMGQCRLPDLLQASEEFPCSPSKRRHVLAQAEQAYNEDNIWDAFTSCTNSWLCCMPCTSFYAASMPLVCGGVTITPKPIYTSGGCLSCFPADINSLPGNCKDQDVCMKHFESSLGSEDLCCMRVGPAEVHVQVTTTPKPLYEVKNQLDDHNFHRIADTSTFLGVLHRPYAWPKVNMEAECQRQCWLDAECYLYSYVTHSNHIEEWRGRCVTWNRPTADLYRRSSPSTWIPEEDVNSGFKFAVRYSDVVVTVSTSHDSGAESVGPLVLYVCRRLGKCQVHTPVQLTQTSCQAGEYCLERGHRRHWVSVVAVPHSFKLHAIRVENMVDDPWTFDRIAVDVDGQIAEYGSKVTVQKGTPWEFTVGCVTTSGWHVTAEEGSPCLTECYDGYGFWGWCWVDKKQTIWGACVPECAKIHHEMKYVGNKKGREEQSGKSCAELDWPTWSDYNDGHAVCGASNAKPLHGCSGLLSWEAAREFCLAAGARLCTEEELRADEVAGSGCGLDRAPVWSATSCKDGGYLTAAGASSHYAEVPVTCTQPAGESASARCCADSRKMVISFRREHRDLHRLPGRMRTRNFGGLANWMVVSGANYLGEEGFFLQSGMLEYQAPFDGDAADVELTGVPVAERGGEIEFYFKIDSEMDADKLHFYIDGKEERRAGFPVSGKIDWKKARFAFPAHHDRDRHSFRWRYKKDDSHSIGADVACLDQIVISGVVGLE